MSEHVYDESATAAGVDASRRVAWARYYQAREDVEAMARINVHLMRYLARLAFKILRSETLAVFEPEGELMVEARRVIAVLRLRSRGRVIVEQLEEEEVVRL